MEELHLMKERDPSAKAIVFSQYVAFLDLLEHRLMVAGIRVVKLNGGMAASARENALKSYKEDHTITVILISLKAGGVALNLTVASHIYLMGTRATHVYTRRIRFFVAPPSPAATATRSWSNTRLTATSARAVRCGRGRSRCRHTFTRWQMARFAPYGTRARSALPPRTTKPS